MFNTSSLFLSGISDWPYFFYCQFRCKVAYGSGRTNLSLVDLGIYRYRLRSKMDANCSGWPLLLFLSISAATMALGNLREWAGIRMEESADLVSLCGSRSRFSSEVYTI